ncbi:MAG: MBL fold metallo-hydrolase [Proteobacteria bacterium]|nr:MBL fold metallo-hydrolase [Pseudomonadota bacterium]
MTGTLNRIIALALLPVAVLTITACQRTAEEPFAKVVPSAIIEVRDEPTQAELDKETQVVMLGTGNPVPDAHRAGPSIAVIHKGEAYLFDIGAGAIQNAVTARYQYDIPSLYPSQICCVFLTHLHSDHTMDYAELAYTLWWRRRKPLFAWGPRGLEQMTQGMVEMMAADTALRRSGVQPVQNPKAHKVNVTEIGEGIVFQKDDLTIEAFAVNHGEIKPAYGYKITTADMSIVISGDTAYSEKVLEKSRGVDLLFHEVISDSGLAGATEFWQNYHKSSHTLASDLGKLASEARPGLLVLYHGLFYGVPEAVIVDEVRTTYDGEVVLADDLDIF